MRILFALLLAALGMGEAQMAPVPMVDEINGRPFVIHDKWKIGGTGNWGYLALDPVARELFIPHQTSVQVVDIESGSLVGEITGFQEARSIVLDPDGQFGYVSDGKSEQVAVFDRRTLQVAAKIDITCSPRSLVLAPEQQLLLAICGSPTPPPALPPRRVSANAPAVLRTQREREIARGRAAKGNSQMVLIDSDTRRLLAYVSAPGDFHAAVTDSDGQAFITVGPSEQPQDWRDYWPAGIMRFDVAGVAERLRQATSEKSATSVFKRWTEEPGRPDSNMVFTSLESACTNPEGLAVDSHDNRLFVACDDQNLLVLDSQLGRVLTTLTTGPGTDAIAYDESRGLIFTANGGGYGSITIIRQHVSDSYAVIQNLPTMERARTMALDPGTGQVYLVTDLHGARLDNPPANGIGKLKLEPVDGSFQVLVIAN